MNERLFQIFTLLGSTRKWLSGRQISDRLNWRRRGPTGPNPLLYGFRSWFDRAELYGTPIWQLSSQLRRGIGPAESPPVAATFDFSVEAVVPSLDFVIQNQSFECQHCGQLTMIEEKSVNSTACNACYRGAFAAYEKFIASLPQAGLPTSKDFGLYDND